MMRFGSIRLLLALCCAGQMAVGQPPIAQSKSINAERIAATDAIKIDGQLNEPGWQLAAPANGFVVNKPNPGAPATYDTDVKVIYDDEAIYIGFMCYDPSPDSILTQLAGRDGDGNSDYCGITFNCYRDGINGFTFAVSPLGEQYDARVTGSGSGSEEDATWNAVWYCKTSIAENGWIAEFKIPWSALRFPDAPEQVWNINFMREVRRIREQTFWNHVDPAVTGYLTQMGTLSGIRNIETPTRLFLFPYASGYLNKQEMLSGPAQTTYSYNLGMDVKYGINDAFTLDATLIPDFGQTISDALILNLTPFEVRLDENRQFFMEGTELFSKAGLFYSRRVGYIPYNFTPAYQPAEGEYYSHAPQQVQLINATKISGRMRNGLGIGLFNAVSAPAKATVSFQDGDVVQSKEVDYYPMTNYNIIVFDQNLKNNSNVAIINTSVLRDGGAYDATVTGTEFTLRNRANSWALSGRAAYNRKFNWHDSGTQDGLSQNLSIAKTNGQWNMDAGYVYETKYFDPNDLGFLLSPNEVTYYLWNGYNIYKPFGAFNRMWSGFNTSLSYLQRPYVFNAVEMNGRVGFITRKFFAFELSANTQPVDGYDYFEPRVDGLFFRTPAYWDCGGWISTDYRHRLALDYGMWYSNFNTPGNYRFNWRVAPRFRVNDHLMLTYVYSRQNHFNNLGWAGWNEADPVFGTRDVVSHTNVLSAAYAFNPTQTITCRVRHYWGFSKYSRFHRLREDGYLAETDYDGFNDDGTSPLNRNFNSFTVDLVYRWIFTPGSELNLVWKNAIIHSENIIPANLADDVSHTFELPQSNSFSIRVLYFLDARTLVHLRKSGRA